MVLSIWILVNIKGVEIMLLLGILIGFFFGEIVGVFLMCALQLGAEADKLDTVYASSANRS